MKKIVSFIIILNLFLLTGCDKKINFNNQCYFTKENGIGMCFSEEGNNGNFILKYEGKYRGTNSEQDKFTWTQDTESENIIIVKYSHTTRNLIDNKNVTKEIEQKYKYNKENKSLEYIAEDDSSYSPLILSDKKLNEINFVDNITVPVTFMGEKSETELSNYYLTTLTYFTLPVQNFKVNEDYEFKLFGLEVFYLPTKKRQEINSNDYAVMYRNIISEYRVCYESDLGKYYYNQMDRGYYITENITYINIDYCNKMNIPDTIDVKKLYSNLSGRCFAKNGRELMCFNDDFTKVYFEKSNDYAAKTINTYDLNIKGGLYTYNDIPIIILNSKSVAGNYDKLSVGSDIYHLFGQTSNTCTSCPEYIEPE